MKRQAGAGDALAPTELKRMLVRAIADEQRLFQRHSEAMREADRWRRRVELALSKGESDLAGAALVRWEGLVAHASRVEREYQAQRAHVERMKEMLRELETATPPVPAAPAPRAVEPRRLAAVERREGAAWVDGTRLAAAWADLERDELAERLEALEREDLLERQLRELKQRLGRIGGQGV